MIRGTSGPGTRSAQSQPQPATVTNGWAAAAYSEGENSETLKQEGTRAGQESTPIMHVLTRCGVLPGDEIGLTDAGITTVHTGIAR